MEKVEDYTISDYLGRKYTFEVYHKEAIVYRKYLLFDDVPGIYLFIRRTANQHGPSRRILYIGRTISLKQRLNYRHEKLYEAIEKGINITHICVHRVLPTTKRKMIFIEPELARIEKNLIAKYETPLNYKVG